MIKGVLFDLDGTLADSLASMALSGNKALADVGLPPQPMDKYKYFAGDGADMLVKRALIAAGDESLDFYDKTYLQYKNYFRVDCTYQVEPFSGIMELLQELKKRKIKIGVISNKPHQRTVDVVNALFGKNYFDILVGQKKEIPKKPDPQSSQIAAKELGILPKECIYVGDTNVDMKTGIAAGMYTVGVLWGFRSREELEKYKPNAIIEQPKELLELL
ncbi:MAG: HAD family hydrolase [Acetivibrio sp.]